jgi:hypothetical protein
MISNMAVSGVTCSGEESPNGPDECAGARGLRAVATLEALKGLLLLLAGLGVLDQLHRDVEETAGNLLLRLHINPEHHLARAFLDVDCNLTVSRHWELAATAAAYSTLRFAEACEPVEATYVGAMARASFGRPLLAMGSSVETRPKRSACSERCKSK